MLILQIDLSSTQWYFNAQLSVAVEKGTLDTTFLELIDSHPTEYLNFCFNKNVIGM